MEHKRQRFLKNIQAAQAQIRFESRDGEVFHE